MPRYSPWPFTIVQMGESFVVHEADYHNAREVARRYRPKGLHFAWRQMDDGKYECTRVEWSPVVLRGPNPYAEKIRNLSICETMIVPHMDYRKAQQVGCYYSRKMGIKLSWRTLHDGSHECGRIR